MNESFSLFLSLDTSIPQSPAGGLLDFKIRDTSAVEHSIISTNDMKSKTYNDTEKSLIKQLPRKEMSM